MSKTDARVRYTRRVLRESFLALLREKPVSRITVKEVCEKAEVNRATFYTHYRDCFDLLESIGKELLEAFGESLGRAGRLEPEALIDAIYDMASKHESACRVLIFGGADPSLPGRMIDLARGPSLEGWRKRLPRADEAELDMLYTLLSSGLMKVVVEGYERHDRDMVTRFVRGVVRTTLEPYR